MDRRARVSERAIVFGSCARMIGVRFESGRWPLPVRMVLVNSGIVHRVGANRMTVTLARALAEDGIDSLRFDMSGIGESLARTDDLSWEASAPLEIIEAIDQIADENSAIVLYGNCGGAAKSLWAAQRDPRVAGLVLTNPPAHPSEEEGIDEVLAQRIAQRIAGELEALLDRGVRMLFIFADGDSGLSYFQNRIETSLLDHLQSGQLRVEIVEKSNHTFSPGTARRAVIAHARRWLDELVDELRTD